MCAWRAERYISYCALAVVTAGLGCAKKQESQEPASQGSVVEFQKEPILPVGVDPARPRADLVELGGKLFHETALSGDGTLACASCHDLSSGGDDGRRVSKGAKGKDGAINAPSVFNASFN